MDGFYRRKKTGSVAFRIGDCGNITDCLHPYLLNRAKDGWEWHQCGITQFLLPREYYL